MKAIKFKQSNIVFAENQDEYESLPALKIDDKYGNVICCYKLSIKDKIKILFTGKVWLNLMTFNKPLTPHYLSVNRKDVFSIPEDNLSFWKKNIIK